MSPPIAGERSRFAWLALAAGLLAILAWASSAPSAQAAFTSAKCAGDDTTGRGASFARDAHTVFNSNFRNLFCAGTPGQGVINVPYEALGSGAGRLAMKVRNDVPRFGMTDEPPAASEIQQMNTGVGNGDPAADTNPNDNGEINVVPAAVGAIAPLVNFPNGCDVGLLPEAARTTGAAAPGATTRVRFTKAQYESIWAAESGFSQWDDVFPTLAPDAECNVDIIRVVRFDESGTTFAFKDYLDTIDPTQGWLTTFGSTTNGTREWPGATFGPRTDCGGTNGPGGGATQDTDRLTSSCSGNAGNLTTKLIGTDGSIGYADVSTARVAGLAVTPTGAPDNDTYWTQLQNGSNVFTEPTADPNGFRTDGLKGANCQSTTFTDVPTSTKGNWAPVSGVNSPNGYGICTLTYGLVFDDHAEVWGNSAAEEAKARTVKDYWDSIVTSEAQSQLFNNDYAPLPANILTIARTGMAGVDWDRASNPPVTPPVIPPTNPPANPGGNGGVSNVISVERTKIDSKDGSVTVQVRLPGAGTLELSGEGVKPDVNVGSVTLNASAAGTFPVKLKPSNAAKRILRKKGKLKVDLTLRFSPTGGTAAEKTAGTTLRIKKKKKK